MAKVKKTKKPIKRVPKKSKKWLLPVICLLLMGLAAAVWYGLLNRSAIEPAATVPQKKETPDFDRLVGNWVRPDGGYVIEISKIHPDGKVDAAYFNPSPIHVSRSTVSEEGGIIELFIELQGQGYPGSTYTLRYNPAYDAMVGIYFQAVIQQPFEVIFQRK
ncbi:MAG: hypothetical protein ACQ9MH_24085 [Nitrospinales bacterium]